MSNLINHAEKELKTLGLFDKDSDYDGELAKDVMELIKLFSEQGHSGHSAAMAILLFKELAGFKTISSHTGNDDEWNEVSDGCFQNNRNSGVFKDNNDSKAYYIHAISWKDQRGVCWNGKADNIGSSQYIKSFPFKPKTFIIDIIAEEVKKDDWINHIKNTEDLDKVWKVYDKYEIYDKYERNNKI